MHCGSENLEGLFQGVWKSAGRGKSCVVSRMRISVDMCSVRHDDAQRGDSFTSKDMHEESLGEGAGGGAGSGRKPVQPILSVMQPST